MAEILAAASIEGGPERTMNSSRGWLMEAPPGGRSSSTSGGVLWSSHTLRCVGSVSGASTDEGEARRNGTGAVWGGDLAEPPRANPNTESA